MGDPKLPEARLRPQDGADRMAILRGQARDASVRAGRVAGGVAKVLATLALCGAGLFAIGAGRARPSYDVDKQLENLRRSQRLLDTMPKIDWNAYQRSLELMQPRYDDRLYRNLEAVKLRGLDEPLLREQGWPSAPKVTPPAASYEPPARTQQQRATLPR